MKSDDLRWKNRERNIIEFEALRTRLFSLPRALFIELTQNCNLHCSYCKNAGHNYRPELNMVPELFQRVADELFPTAEMVDLRGIGESTILKDFSHYVEIASGFGVQLRIVTNGMNPSPSVWEPLMASKAIVVVSCDSSDPQVFSELRRGGDLKRLIKTVKTITKYRDLYNVPRENIYLSCVVSQKNINHLSELLEFANELTLSKVILFPVSVPSTHPLKLNGVETISKGLNIAIETANSLNLTVQLGAALDEALSIKQSLKSHCINPWTYALIDYSGRVGFCDHLIGIKNYTFGSLLNDEFIKIWNNRKFRFLRFSHKHRKFPVRFFDCRWCYKMRYVDFEQIFYEKYADNVVSNEKRYALY